MPKLTAELFAGLPEELQQKILKEVPAHRLNEIEVMTPDDLDIEDTQEEMKDILTGLSRKQSITVIVELVNAITQQMMGMDAPVEIRMAASLSILKQVLAETNNYIDKVGGLEDDD